MDKLLEKYFFSEKKTETINGLLIAQALCTRRLIEGIPNSSEAILAVMDDIVKVIEQISESP